MTACCSTNKLTWLKGCALLIDLSFNQGHSQPSMRQTLWKPPGSKNKCLKIVGLFTGRRTNECWTAKTTTTSYHFSPEEIVICAHYDSGFFSVCLVVICICHGIAVCCCYEFSHEAKTTICVSLFLLKECSPHTQLVRPPTWCWNPTWWKLCFKC